MKRVPFKIEFTGTVEVEDFTSADAFRELRKYSNWQDLVHDEEYFQIADLNREILEVMCNDPQLLRDRVAFVAMLDMGNKVAELEDRLSKAGGSEVIATRAMPQLSEQSAKVLRDLISKGELAGSVEFSCARANAMFNTPRISIGEAQTVQEDKSLPVV